MTMPSVGVLCSVLHLEAVVGQGGADYLCAEVDDGQLVGGGELVVEDPAVAFRWSENAGVGERANRTRRLHFRGRSDGSFNPSASWLCLRKEADGENRVVVLSREQRSSISRTLNGEKGFTSSACRGKESRVPEDRG